MSRQSKVKRFFVAFVAVVVAYALILGSAAVPTAFAKRANASPIRATSVLPKWAGNASSTTILVYLNGSDLESEAGLATADISEMLESGIGANANVVIETLGTRQWQNYGIASDHTQRYIVNQGKLELVDDSLPQLDTTSPDTLSDFIAWGTANYPADRYMLILWDHGAGPVYGFGYDEFQSEESALTLDEMKQALEANPSVHFDIIGMDCCIMGSLETCVALQPYCDYMVVSEDFEPGIGWSYEGWMRMLEQDPSISTVELGTAIVDDMIGDAKTDPEGGDATLALIDESAVDELYMTWMDFAFANADNLLENNYSQQTEWQTRPEYDRANTNFTVDGYDDESYEIPGEDSGWDMWNTLLDWYGNGGLGGNNGWGSYDDWSTLWELWDSDGSYVTMTDYFVTDIMTVASSIEGNQANALQAAFDDAMVYYGSTEGEEGMSGLGVTLPYGNEEFYSQLAKVFNACGIDREYVEWLESFTKVENPAGATDEANVSDPYGELYSDPYGNGPLGGDLYSSPYGDIYGDPYSSPYSDTYGSPYGDTYGDPYGNIQSDDLSTGIMQA